MKDTVMKNEKWTFDEEVTSVFDNMLERSIPSYVNMRDLVFKIGSDFITPYSCVIDIGCSNGNAILPFVKNFCLTNSFKLYDVSEPMLKECEKRFNNYKDMAHIDIQKYDLKKGLVDNNASLILSVLTLQFTPIEYRQKIVKSIYNSLNKNGAFILVEKVLGDTFEIDKILINKYYQMKLENSYTQEQIENKRKSLEGVLVPITSNWNIDLLKGAGFKQVDCFWRDLNFAGFIAIK